MILVPLVLALAQQASPPAVQLAPVRPRDPFVFRCVLDKRARMLVAALDEEMWVAWDTSTGGLYKAWKGGVNFDGAVYTTVHGPQPTSKGQDYVSAPGGSPWVAYVDGKQVETKTHYVGYVLRDQDVVLEWKVSFGTGREVLVSEQPDFWRTRAGAPEPDGAQVFGKHTHPALQRHFTAIGLRAGEQINLVFRVDGSSSMMALASERIRNEDVVVGTDEKGQPVTVTQAVSELPLKMTAPENAILLGFNPITLPPPTEETKK